MLGLNWPGYQKAITFEARDEVIDPEQNISDIFCSGSVTSSRDLEQNRD